MPQRYLDDPLAPKPKVSRRPGRRREIDVDILRERCNRLLTDEHDPRVREGIRYVMDLILDLAVEHHGYSRLTAAIVIQDALGRSR